MPSTMFDGTTLITIALTYVSALFAIAWMGDRAIRLRQGSSGRPIIYALSIAVYCTSWTFFGSVGLAANTGFDFIPVYLGPIMMFALGTPLLLRIVRLAKSQNLTSVADFMAARYGKSQSVAAIVTLVLVAGTLPYIALQLKAVAISIETLLGGGNLVSLELPRIGFADTAIIITLALAAFAILFGTRNIDTAEHQDGLILAIAVESMVKLAAFMTVGLFVTYSLFDGPKDLWARAAEHPVVQEVMNRPLSGGMWMTVTFLSFVCIILLPRQFHVIVVENNSEREVRRAAWMFPLYLILINLFVIPIAMAGLMLLPRATTDPDFHVLALPMVHGAPTITLIAFIGGLSAATAMVIVEAVALSIMISNGLVMPMLVRWRRRDGDDTDRTDLSGLVLFLRRMAILVILILAYFVYWALGETQSLVTIGLISFAAIAQVAPAFFGGLIWRSATASGAIAGLLTGSFVWFYTLLLPWIAKAGFIPMAFVTDGPFDIAALRPQALFFLQFEPLPHGVFWSLTANVVAFFLVSALRAPEPIERLQAKIFVPDPPALMGQSRASKRSWRTTLTMTDLERTVARYLGAERASDAFTTYAMRQRAPTNLAQTATGAADVHAIRFTEHLLTSAVGAASSRLIMALTLNNADKPQGSATQLLDDANEALQFNRDLLQSALDQVRHGLAVFDRDMRLICWNRQFNELLSFPDDIGAMGMPLDALLRTCATKSGIDAALHDGIVGDRLLKLAVHQELYHERELSGDKILEVRTSPMPQGGIVITFSDITQRVNADAVLARVNETLERRVTERTVELMTVNTALSEAKAEAEAANLDKTRFIAAASHDILQPLNAARLYAASLVERPLATHDSHLVRNLDASLVAVEEIFSALIDVSRLDARRMEPDIESFALAPMLDQLRVEFAPFAHDKGLRFSVMTTQAWVRTDRRLLRRVLQNLIANAIKYTPKGGVLIGARSRGNKLAIAIYDTGPGIAEEHRTIIFKEFHRLNETAGSQRGVGLGLSIVERICKVLSCRLELRSRVGSGSVFAVNVPQTLPVIVTRLAHANRQPAVGSFEGLRILCIDNEPAVLAGMEALLKGWNCTIETTSNAQAVINRRMGFPRANAGWPDIILADYHLDYDTGLDAIAAVRKAAQIQIPAIVITADQSTDIQRAIRTQGFAHLKKPIKPAALRAAIAQVLVERRVRANEGV